MTTVGVLGGGRRARVGPHGSVAPLDTTWALDWWIGADDRWRVPSRETTVRQSLVDDMPVVRTAMRVPGGDAVARAYGVPGSGDPIVVEIENDSPVPFVAAFVVRGARSVAAEGGLVAVDGKPALLAPRPPSRWSAGRRERVEVAVCSGAAELGPFPYRRDRGGRLDAAFLHPVAHRTTLRLAVVGYGVSDALDLRSLPSADDAARGWRAQLDRGLRVELPDDRLAGTVRAARAGVLLAATAPIPTGATVAALEDWGFDAEAREAWERLSGRERRKAARRAAAPSIWMAVRAAIDRGGADLLLALRSMLVHEDGATVTILGELPAEWLGGVIEVHDAPTRAGLVSYAVRWHGERPALLWDAPPGVVLRAPGLDAEWSTTVPKGEALLAGRGNPA